MDCLYDWLVSILVVFALVAVFGWTGERDLQDAQALAGFGAADYRLSAFVGE